MKYIIFLLIPALFACRGNHGKPSNGQTINVMGNAVVKARPDISSISMNLSAESPNKAEAVNQINKTVSEVLAQVKAMHIKTNAIVINDLSIYWDYIYNKDKTRTLRYSARQTIEVKLGLDMTEIEKVVQIVKDVPKLDFYIGFDLSEGKRDSINGVLARMAMKDANSKSENIAAAANLSVKEILDISYHVEHPNVMLRGNAKYEVAMDANDPSVSYNTSLSPDDIVLTDHIQVSYLVVNK